MALRGNFVTCPRGVTVPSFPSSVAGAPFPGLTGAAVSSRVLLLATLSLCGDDTGDCHRIPPCPEWSLSRAWRGQDMQGPCLGHSVEHPALSCLCLTGPVLLLLLLFAFSGSRSKPSKCLYRLQSWDVGFPCREWGCRPACVGVPSSINELGCLSRTSSQPLQSWRRASNPLLNNRSCSSENHP